MRAATVAAAALAGLASRPHAAPPADPAPVVAAERAFAARTAEVGVTQGFLAFVADDAVIFAPGPVSAKAFYARRPPGRAPADGGTRLAWWPRFAGVARSGDLGFTTGPATVNGKPGLFYATVWARQPDGGWKWIFDGGIDAQADDPGPGTPPRAMGAGDAAPLPRARAWAQVAAAEAGLKDAGGLAARLAPDAQVQSPGSPPAWGAAAKVAVIGRPVGLAWRLVGGGASRTGDLAWTWGDAGWSGGRAHFMRVWRRRGGAWQVVFDELV